MVTPTPASMLPEILWALCRTPFGKEDPDTGINFEFRGAVVVVTMWRSVLAPGDKPDDALKFSEQQVIGMDPELLVERLIVARDEMIVEINKRIRAAMSCAPQETVCTVCGLNWVDADAGFDTCSSCLGAA